MINSEEARAITRPGKLWGECTWPGCKRGWVGVVTDVANKGRGRPYKAPVYKLARHAQFDYGPLCGGSRVEVPPEKVRGL